MHRLARDVFSEADFGGVCVSSDDGTQDGPVRINDLGFRERFEGEKPASSCNDGVFAAPVLADNKRLQQAMRCDGCGELVDAFVPIRLANIAGPGEQCRPLSNKEASWPSAK